MKFQVLRDAPKMGQNNLIAYREFDGVITRTLDFRRLMLNKMEGVFHASDLHGILLNPRYMVLTNYNTMTQSLEMIGITCQVAEVILEKLIEVKRDTSILSPVQLEQFITAAYDTMRSTTQAVIDYQRVNQDLLFDLIVSPNPTKNSISLNETAEGEGQSYASIFSNLYGDDSISLTARDTSGLGDLDAVNKLGKIRAIDFVLYLISSPSKFASIFPSTAPKNPRAANENRKESVALLGALATSIVAYPRVFAALSFHKAYSEAKTWMQLTIPDKPYTVEIFNKLIKDQDPLGASVDVDYMFAQFKETKNPLINADVTVVPRPYFQLLYSILYQQLEQASTDRRPTLGVMSFLEQGEDIASLALRQSIEGQPIAYHTAFKHLKSIFALQSNAQELLDAFILDVRHTGGIIISETQVKAIAAFSPRPPFNITPKGGQFMQLHSAHDISHENAVPVTHTSFRHSQQLALALSEKLALKFMSARTLQSWYQHNASFKGVYVDETRRKELATMVGRNWKSYVPAWLSSDKDLNTGHHFDSYEGPAFSTDEISPLSYILERMTGYNKKTLQDMWRQDIVLRSTVITYLSSWCVIVDGIHDYASSVEALATGRSTDPNGLTYEQAYLSFLTNHTVITGYGAPYGTSYADLARIQVAPVPETTEGAPNMRNRLVPKVIEDRVLNITAIILHKVPAPSVEQEFLADVVPFLRPWPFYTASNEAADVMPVNYYTEAEGLKHMALFRMNNELEAPGIVAGLTAVYDTDAIVGSLSFRPEFDFDNTTSEALPLATQEWNGPKDSVFARVVSFPGAAALSSAIISTLSAEETEAQEIAKRAAEELERQRKLEAELDGNQTIDNPIV